MYSTLSFSLKEIRFTLAFTGAISLTSRRASAFVSLMPLISMYSNVILFRGFISYLLQVSRRSFKGYFRLTGISRDRVSSSVAFRDTARLTGVSLPSFSICGRSPAVETVTRLGENLRPKSVSVMMLTALTTFS